MSEEGCYNCQMALKVLPLLKRVSRMTCRLCGMSFRTDDKGTVHELVVPQSAPVATEKGDVEQAR